MEDFNSKKRKIGEAVADDAMIKKKKSQTSRPLNENSNNMQANDLNDKKKAAWKEKKRIKKLLRQQEQQKDKTRSDTIATTGNQSTPMVAKAQQTVISPAVSKPVIAQATAPNNSKLSVLQQQFAKKLEGARFRSINEELYTTTGESAFQDFQQHPEKFEIYHKGYREQAAQWPINPLDSIIQWIRSNHGNAIIADMGCGEARLSASVRNKVYSFDLVAANERVTACNIAHVPLESNLVDVVVFCLSLMGTNFQDFIIEAHRILKMNGILKIVEVRSRFEDNDGIKRFIQYLKNSGFQVKSNNGKMNENKMFFDVECTKTGGKVEKDANFTLKACQYKKR